MSEDAPSLIDDCFLHDKDRLRHEEALKLLQERLSAIVARETLSTSQALGRILAEDVTASHEVPLHTNAAVDGYAFDSADFDGSPMSVSGMPVSSRVSLSTPESRTKSPSEMPRWAWTFARCSSENEAGPPISEAMSFVWWSI